MNPGERRLFSHLDWGLLFITLTLFGIGIVNLYSASGVRVEEGLTVSAFYQKQLIWGVLGFACMLICISFDYRTLQTMIVPFYILSIILLLTVPILGKTVYGAKRWISLGLFNIQPSELAKITVLIMGAKVLSLNGERLGWKRLIQVVSVGLIPAGLILIQPDLGTALTILALLGGMIIYHGIIPYIFRTCLVIIPLCMPLAWFGLQDYQKQRILTFLDPSIDPRGAGYHITQSQIAIGSGNLFGKGFLEGTQSQLRFLPEKHTDFAIAVFGEEWGFIGCVVLLTLFCFFLLKMINIIKEAKDRFGSTLVAGIFFYFFWQMLVNMGMVVGIMPVVGIPLPFISYGGTATIVNFALIGIVLNVSMRKFLFKT